MVSWRAVKRQSSVPLWSFTINSFSGVSASKQFLNLAVTISGIFPPLSDRVFIFQDEIIIRRNILVAFYHQRFLNYIRRLILRVFFNNRCRHIYFGLIIVGAGRSIGGAAGFFKLNRSCTLRAGSKG